MTVNMAMLYSALTVSGWGLLWGFLCSTALYFTVLLIRWRVK